MTCTFFGHRDFPREMMPNLRAQIVHLIENRGVSQFYVGNQGYFDYAVLQILRSCRQIYPQISYSVVLAYMPQQELPGIEDTETLLPEQVELAPRRYAICRRNRWMLEHADCVVTYIRHAYGGAARYAALAHGRERRFCRFDIPTAQIGLLLCILLWQDGKGWVFRIRCCGCKGAFLQ